MEATAVYEMTNDIHAERKTKKKSKAVRVMEKWNFNKLQRHQIAWRFAINFGVFQCLFLWFAKCELLTNFYMEINTQFDMAAFWCSRLWTFSYVCYEITWTWRSNPFVFRLLPVSFKVAMGLPFKHLNSFWMRYYLPKLKVPKAVNMSTIFY